jgi:hypothetical protein
MHAKVPLFSTPIVDQDHPLLDLASMWLMTWAGSLRSLGHVALVCHLLRKAVEEMQYALGTPTRWPIPDVSHSYSPLFVTPFKQGIAVSASVHGFRHGNPLLFLTQDVARIHDLNTEAATALPQRVAAASSLSITGLATAGNNTFWMAVRKPGAVQQLLRWRWEAGKWMCAELASTAALRNVQGRRPACRE